MTLSGRLLGALLLAVSWSAAAQAPPLSWAVLIDSGTTNSDTTRVIRRMNNGDIIAASQVFPASVATIRISRLNGTTGAAVWTTDVSPGNTSDDTNDMVIDPATGDAWLASRISITGQQLNWNIFKVRGSDGVVQWSTQFNGSFNGNDDPRSICMTSDGNVVVAGQYSTGTGATGSRVAKYDASTGAQMWAFQPTTDWQSFSRVVADGAGNAIAAGFVNGASLSTENGYIVKFNAGGTVVWSMQVNGANNDFDAALTVDVDSAGNAYAALESRVVPGVTVNDDHVLVVKLAAATGLEQWRTSLTGALVGSDAPNFLILDSSDNVFVGGAVYETSATGSDALLARLNSSTGAVVWSITKTGSADGSELFRSIALNGSELYAATVMSNTVSATQQNDIYLGRFNPSNGATLWEIVYNSSGTKNDQISTRQGAALIASATDTVFVAGQSQNPAANQTDGVIRKYASVATAPEIVVEQPLGTDIPNNGSKSFGSVNIGNSSSLTFTIKNTGNANLTGLTITKDGANPTEFTVTANPTAPVAGPSGTTTFTVQFSPAASGTRSAAIHIANNDGDENPFNITLNGTGVDVTPPTATVTVTDTSLLVGETSLVTFAFSEAVSGFANADLNVASGSLSAVSSSNGNVTFTATLTPTVSIEDPTNVITLNMAGVTDLSSNAGTGTTNSNNYAIDTLRPTVSFALVTDTALNIGETSPVSIIFSEAVNNFSNADLTIPNATLTAVSSSNGGVTWTATLTPTAGVTDPTNMIAVNLGTLTDLPGNGGTGSSNSTNYAIDTVRPILANAITISDPNLGIGETALVTFVFAEAVTGFAIADVTAPNATLSGLSSGDGGITWTATLTPTVGVTDATNVLTLDYTGIADLAGNAGAGSVASGNYAVDAQAPTVIGIVVADAALIIGETSLVTFTFSEAVSGFTNANLTIASGTLTAVSSANGGVTFTATLTPTAGIEDPTNVIALNMAGVTDLSSNAGSGTTNSSNYAIDTLRPTVTSVVVTDTALIIGETSLVTIVFSEAVTAFSNADLTIPSGTLTAVSSSNGGVTWTATLTPNASVTDPTNLIVVNLATLTDVPGNAGSGTSNSNNYAIDTVRPTLASSITISDTNLAIGDTATVTFTFTEAVSGFSTADVARPNASFTSLTSSDGGITWTATLTPNAGVTDASNVLTLDLTGVLDVPGNAGAGTVDSGNYAIDTQRPTVASFVVADNNLLAGETSLVTVTYSEAVTGFTSADLTVENGVVSSLTTGDGGITWTMTLTPTASIIDASNLITLDLTGVLDLAGNAGVGSSLSNNYAIHTVRPTVAVVVTDTLLVSGETSPVTFTFSEAVSGFTNADFSVANGTLSAVSSGDGGVTFTATLTPTPGINDPTNVITVTNGGYTNVAGNAGSGTTDSNNYAIDTVARSLSIDDVSVAEGNGGTATLNFTVTVTPAAADGGVGFSIATQDGTATAPADYTARSLTGQTIASGQSTFSFAVTVNGDNLVELDETVLVNLSGATGAVIGDGQGIGTISNDDSATVQFNPLTASQSEAVSPMVFTATLTNPVDVAVTVTVDSGAGTATAADFTPISGGTMTFPANSTSQPVNVLINNDALDENDENFTLTLSSPNAAGRNVALGAGTPATGTIVDDDPTPTLSVTSPSLAEGNAGTSVMTFTVSLGAVSGRDVTFMRATADGTATVANNDYVALVAGVGTIPAGQMSLDIPVTINGDTPYEGDESFSLDITGVSNATPASISGTGTIVDDDQQPTTTTITGDTPAPSVTGEAYTVSVTVMAQTTSPLGTVAISDGSASCNATLVTGTAPNSAMSCVLVSTTAGAKTLTANYTAASSAFADSSGTAPHLVNPAATTISVSGPPRSRVNQPTSFSFALSVNLPGAGTPTGTVTLSSGASSCTATLPATSCNLSFAALGSRTVSASYVGDANFNGSTSSGPGNMQTLVYAVSDIAVSKSDAITFFRPGELIVYTVQVRNLGPDAAQGIRIRDDIPVGLANTVWSCDASGGATCPVSGGSGNLDTTTAGFPVGGLLTYTFYGIAQKVQQILNQALVELPADTTVEDLLTDNNSASDLDISEFIFQDGFEDPIVVGPTGTFRLPGLALRETVNEVAVVAYSLDDVGGEALRIYARQFDGRMQYALALRGPDDGLRLGAWQTLDGEPLLEWTARAETTGGYRLQAATLH